jgi:nucleotide-binding universal stress UspA family protein
MIPFKRILVDIDALAGEHPALECAFDLAARSGADVTVVDILPEVPASARRFVTNEIEQELVAHRSERLTAVAATHGPRARPALLRGTPAVAIVQEVMRGDYDLVVRSHGRDLAVPPPPFGVVDMQLLRTCPCPVWLVGPGASLRPRNLVAAIDASENDPGEALLNRRIFDLALTVQDLEDGTLTILYAWSVFGRDLLRHRMSPREFDGFVGAARQAASADLDRFIARLGPLGAPLDVRLVEGEPHEVIPAYAVAHHIDLVVMGTVARTGLAGFVMGNTAERVLRELRGSVLAVKPPSFVSPVVSRGAPRAVFL